MDRKKTYVKWILFLILIVCWISCKEDATIPRPRMYPRIEFPPRNIAIMNMDYCPLVFEFPDFATVKQEKNFFEEKAKDPCWFNLDIKPLNSIIYCSYSPIDDNFDKLVKDAFKMAGKHNIKADYRKESLIENPKKNVYGLMFNIEGPVATPIQFFLTDSVRHFFRASLYFNSEVNPDSTKIVLDFLSRDINHMIETFEWK